MSKANGLGKFNMFAYICDNNKEVFEREWQWMRRVEGRRGVEII